MPTIKKTKLENFSKYIISSDGTVQNFKTKEFLFGSINKRGSREIKLYSDTGEKKTFLLHNLIIRLFKPQSKQERLLGFVRVGFLDGNKTNCNLNNLYWCTVSDSLKKRKLPKGARHFAYRPISDYETTPILKSDFKIKCIKEGLWITDFIEVYSGKDNDLIFKNNKREKKYYYKKK